MLMRRTKLGRTWMVGRLVVGLVVSACGDDTTQKGNDQSSAMGDGDGDGDSNGELPKGNLADGIVGKTCATGSDTCTGGTCASELTGGTLGRLGAPLPAPNGYCTAACTGDAQCGEGGVCFGTVFGSNGECRRKCKANGDCGEGQECATTNLNFEGDAGAQLEQFKAADTCQPLPSVTKLGANVAGKSCSANSDCGEGTCNTLGGSYCTGACSSNGDCGEGGVCIRGLYGSAGRCEEACSTDTDCQNDANGWGCGGGETKYCIVKADPLPTGTVGKACTPATASADCGPGSCRQRGFSNETYPGGYCIASCTADADCGSDGACINGTTCMKKCSSATECRPEYECKKHPSARGTSPTICFPKAGTGNSDAGT